LSSYGELDTIHTCTGHIGMSDILLGMDYHAPVEHTDAYDIRTSGIDLLAGSWFESSD